MHRFIALLFLALPTLSNANSDHVSFNYLWGNQKPSIQLGPRPYYLVDDMDAGSLKETLKACTQIRKFRKSDFSIGHRGAPMQFPEHTRESYEAAARMGAGILECDVTFTQDKELVCRHSQCDLHTTTNILETELAQQCSEPFKAATFDEEGNLLEPASAKCCTSDITLEQFKTLKGKMDAFNPKAKTVAEYLDGTANWRTDLYASRGTLMTHRESIQLFKKLGVKMTPELKSPSMSMPFDGFSQQDYAQKLINEYREEGVSPRKVWPQSFNKQDVEYWIDNNPRFGRQAVFLDGRYDNPAFNHRKPETWSPSMEELAARGVQIIAPPMWMLLDVEDGQIVPSLYALSAKEAGLDIITWTVERSGPLTNGGGWYYQTLNGQNPPEGYSQSVINNDGDMMTVIDVLAMDVGVLGIFSDWPATTSYYANCMGI
ncbi:glycerophosphodiester phosphodiesterase family protein [Endozoicomonas numazuensis]|uniref:glycerophosphodiester phosphodiesterase n=1 Tax=Endozoicomonas numazuensis TaxID=1137799 RepID=A0A081N6G7_9GAMM|nr:glycerophosphodiester phosphodiesterase family protein [Endozoicomonas numazuensis]KEQ14040.1 glycerophosphodiester phosphodiesterase [Endozoicomonas numazuensis]